MNHTATTSQGFRPVFSSDDLQRNLAAVNARIRQACEHSGRQPDRVRLLPVSKTVDLARIRMAHAAGCTLLGENKVQEAWSKAQSTTDLTDLRWAVIGHLQTNKARIVARFASEFQALDSLRLAAELDKRLSLEERCLDVLVQVNTSGEASKYGQEPAQLEAFMRQLSAFPTLRVKGLMTLAALTTDQQRIRRCFVLLRQQLQQMQQQLSYGDQLYELSMGMSSDFELAIHEGATTVRVGQAIFGPRALPDSYYWPEQTGA
ncbi:YggS family pyridoxal phosphate-dependent enzyme [Thalassolituus sp. UBA2009]|uniref:YggS family pyridoxal phosphate-dependent enzyme n=1 Tax=Thalassolituus sp. UBA2009 TaxID=1947658 RepID=UPI00257E1D32|nr:YggS family pyridoxal phosphate-dependent enzyme [Thalassolituus sp. UBA2009]